MRKIYLGGLVQYHLPPSKASNPAEDRKLETKNLHHHWAAANVTQLCYPIVIFFHCYTIYFKFWTSLSASATDIKVKQKSIHPSIHSFIKHIHFSLYICKYIHNYIFMELDMTQIPLDQGLICYQGGGFLPSSHFWFSVCFLMRMCVWKR